MKLIMPNENYRARQRHIVPLKREHAPKILDVFTRAIAAEYAWIFPGDDAHFDSSQYRVLAAYLLNYGHKYGMVDCCSDDTSVATWLTPEACFHELFNGITVLPIRTLAARFRCLIVWWRLRRELDNMRKKLLPIRHWYLVGLGVHELINSEVATFTFINSVILKSEARGDPIYAEVNTASKVIQYERLGFRLMHIFRSGNSGIIYCLCRSCK